MERDEVHNRLLHLSTHAFDWLLRQMEISPADLPSSNGPHAARVNAFLWALDARTDEAGRKKLRVALERAEKLPVASTSSHPVDGELDEIKGLLEAHEYPLAKTLLERIERRQSVDLPPSRRIRLLSQKGYIHLAQGDQIAAAREYLNAVRIAPNEEKTRTDEALAHELLEDTPRAQALAEKLIADFPLSPRPLAIWLRTAPAECSAEAQEKMVSSKKLPQDIGEVWLAIAARALTQQDFVRAERLGSRAVELEPDWPPGWLFLGLAVGRSVLPEGEPRPARFSAAQQERLRQAASHFKKAVDLAEKEKRIPIQLEALVGLARAHDLLNDPKTAEDALRKANQLKPDEGPILFCLGAFLRERERHQEAVELLEHSLRLQATSRTEFLLALALSARKQDGDRVRATGLFARVARTAQQEFCAHALKFAVQGYLAVKEFDAARRLLSEVSTDAVSAVLHHALSGLVSLDAGEGEGEIERAGGHADSALRGWTSSCDPLGTNSLAFLLGRLNRHSEALPLWQALFEPDMPGQEVDGLLVCAQQLQRDDILLGTCQRLREAGTASTTVRHLEFSLLERYEPGAAAMLLEEYVAKHPEDHIARLALSSCKLRTGQLDAADLKLDQVPAAKDIDPHPWRGRGSFTGGERTGTRSTRIRLSACPLPLQPR